MTTDTPELARAQQGARWWTGVALAIVFAVLVGQTVASTLTARDATSSLKAATAELQSQGQRLAKRGDTIEDLSASLGAALGQLNNRSSNARHVICTDELTRRLVAATVAYVGAYGQPGSQDRLNAFLFAGGALDAGLDPTTGVCPPLPT